MIDGFGDADEIKALCAALPTRAGAEVEYSGADMSRPEQIDRMVQDAEARFGAVDILINNAGIRFVSPVEEFSDAKWEQIIAINLYSNFYAIKAVPPGMKTRNAGRIASAPDPRLGGRPG